MPVRKFKPTTPTLRFKTVSDFKDVTGKSSEKSLTKQKKRTGGRNNHGRITTRHRGGGHKKRFRVIDFNRNKFGVPARVASIDYDPNRSANIALLHYKDGEKRYILAPVGLEVGAEVLAGKEADIFPGNAKLLKDIPVGTMIHNIEMRPGKGAQLVRSAGVSAQLMAREGRYAAIKMPSGEVRKILVDCIATIGQVANIQHENIVIGKAGRSRLLGRRPKVRGIAMNPVDHPHGGGEGRGKGNIPQSPWGQFAKGLKTRKNKRTNSMVISKRKRKKGK